LRQFRTSLWDAPMILWCSAPLLSGAANQAVYEGAFRGGLRDIAYLILAWGIPYLLGRVYFSGNESLALAARAFVIGGLCYVPICLIELFTGPQFYAHVYGYQPYRWLGAARYIGFRPIGFLEDGNQLGIWMAAATLSAAGLWKQCGTRRVLGLPIGWVAIVLFATTVLCQSAGSIVFLICVLPLVLAGSLTLRRGLVVAFALVVFFFAGLRLSNAISVRQLVEHNRAAHATALFLKKIGRQSLGWRLAQDERHVKAALAKPILGSGQWDWWKSGGWRPWGLWLLAYGMYGGVGLMALEAMQFLPVIGAAWFATPRDDPDIRTAIEEVGWRYDGVQLVLAAPILLAAIDNLLNCGMILPLVLAIGGLSAWKTKRRLPESGTAWESS
jgi:hypothetical protein